MKNIIKIIVVGFCTTVCRIIAQLLIPAGEQTVLMPSIFVTSGTMPLVFTVYGIFCYSIIAILFLIIRNYLSGNKIIQGLKYGAVLSAIWTIYLLEPLPHVASLDKFAYPLADSFALIVMGILVGNFFGQSKKLEHKKLCFQEYIVPFLTISVCFIIGRLIQYNAIKIYSCYNTERLDTVIWCICTGIIVALSIIFFKRHLKPNNFIYNALITGGVLFGINLILFNFFVPLVFKADILDLILRTVIDFLSVIIGSLTLNVKLKLNNGVKE